jgi:hypothetical protein
MDVLFNKINLIDEIKNVIINGNSKYYKHTFINNYNIDENAISVVMTASNRSNQVYYTLFTFLDSNYKNIHVILVDDSSTDPVSIDILKKFPFAIDFIEIIREEKFWINPCVNYNIGFQYIKGSKIIIQNSEVCHVGDVLSYVNNKLKENTYFAFDVKACSGYSSNDYLYNIHTPLTIDIYNVNIFSKWYQHTEHINRQLHFLTACSRNTFNKFKGFSLDYAFSADYDDDDLAVIVKCNNIEMVSIAHETENVGGIHLYHTLAHSAWTNRTSNLTIYQTKLNYVKNYNKYLEISKGKSTEEYYYRMYALVNYENILDNT